MGIKKSIQQSFILKPGIKSHQRNRTHKDFVSLTKASTIGIIADLRDDKSNKPIADFYSKLKRDRVNYRVLLFVDEKRENINQYDYEKLFPGALITLISATDYTYLGVPFRKVINPFITGYYDIVFRIGLGPCFEMDMVLVNTQASMYAGHDNPELPFLDFGITLEENASIESLTNNLLIYLAKLDQDSSKSSEKKDFTLF